MRQNYTSLYELNSKFIANLNVTLSENVRIKVQHITMAQPKQHELSLTPTQEAERYLENARQLLSEKAGKKDGLYKDVTNISGRKKAFILPNRRVSRII